VPKSVMRIGKGVFMFIRVCLCEKCARAVRLNKYTSFYQT